MSIVPSDHGGNAVFAQPAPSLPPHEIAAIVATLYGITGQVSPLVSERDQNAALSSGSDRYVVKLSNPGEAPEIVHLQAAALTHLATVDPELAVPRVMQTVTGDPVSQVETTKGTFLIRVVTYLPGQPLAEVGKTPELLLELGTFIGRVSAAFASFAHPAAHRDDFLWNLMNAQAVRLLTPSIANASDRALVENAFERHRTLVVPALPHLRVGVLHHDANDYNVLALDGRVSGLIDFGDMAYGPVINELAVTLAYALLDVSDIIASARSVISGYCAAFPLNARELRVLFDLVATRLAMSVVISSDRASKAEAAEAAEEVDPYLLISQAPALRLLRRLMSMRADYLHFAAREAAGFSPVPVADEIQTWLTSPACRPSSILGRDLRRVGRVFVSMADGAPGTEFAGNAQRYWTWLQNTMAEERAEFAIGGYGEDRNVYRGDQFRTDAPEPRSVHLGVDLFGPPDTPVHAMLNGTVRFVVDNASRYDYGPTVMLEHRAGAGGPPFFVLYGHLSQGTLELVEPGQSVQAGDVVGWIGDDSVNGGWAPHVHVQLITDLMDSTGNFEGAGEPSRMSIWRSLSPDPNPLLRLTPESYLPVHAETSAPALTRRRSERLGPSLSTSYRRKLHLVRGEGAYLIDDRGRSYLDLVNNVCHVGHAHPRVVEALTRQARLLNTNTRYLHRNILDLADRLVATFPDSLSVVYFVNSGSEATELALRMARTATGRHDAICVDWAYHGNTAAAIEVSPYKFNRAGGAGRAPYVHITPLADPYRGPYLAHDLDAGTSYAELLAAPIAAAIGRNGCGPAAFIAESISGCGGQVIFPDGFLRQAFEHVRAAGGVCIADEVQVGLGRVGEAMWAYDNQGAVADIVTIGKPFGNGHPLGAVVTTPAIAKEFANGMEYFNTFGGNPVSCAVGAAVLDVIEQEGLQTNAATVGAYTLRRLKALQQRHECMGDVRGKGLYIGVDLVEDRVAKAPATELASDVANALRERGVLISTDGPHDNVLKIKPPLVIGADDIDVFIAELDAALSTR